jgi:hypothetical protein
MAFDSLSSPDVPRHLFPPDSPLRRLVLPTFHTVRRSMAGLCVSAIWVDGNLDPRRAGFRPPYDQVHGQGASTVMPFIMTWISTGPGTEATGNTCLFPGGIDRTLIDYALRLGTLGDHRFVDSLDDIRATVAATGRKLYSIDDLGPEYDDISVISSELSVFTNTKDTLSQLTGYGPVEILRDMYEVTTEDYRTVARPGYRMYLKTCNTETAGQGVEICEDESGFWDRVRSFREAQARFGLSRKLVIQREIKGRNRSFNIFLDPRRRDEVPVIALTNQLIEADGKTYRGSENFEPSAERLVRVGPVILDMVDRLWARFPEAFGFLMCDFFETPEGDVVVFDPGLRPSGNTATAMVFLLTRLLCGRSLFVGSFPIDTGKPGLEYAEVVRRLGRLADLESIPRDHRCVLPWGWNRILGKGNLIGVADDQAGFRELVATVTQACR